MNTEYISQIDQAKKDYYRTLADILIDEKGFSVVNPKNTYTQLTVVPASDIRAFFELLRVGVTR